VPGVERDVTASGVRVRLTDSGEGPPVVLLHGLFLDHTTWDALSATLAESRRVIAPDLPGFGASEKPSSNRFSYHVDAFTETVSIYDMSGKIIFSKQLMNPMNTTLDLSFLSKGIYIVKMNNGKKYFQQKLIIK
jgi:hypothetical protein